MNKPLLKRLLILIAVILTSVCAKAQFVKSGNFYYQIVNIGSEIGAVVSPDSEKYARQEGTYSGNLVIPETMEYDGTTYSVIGVNGSSFLYCTDLRSLSIPKTVRSAFVFQDCPNLTSVVIAPENPYIFIENGIIYTKECNVNNIAVANRQYIYGAVPALVKGDVVIPEGVENIYYFQNCTGLTSLSFPASLVSFENSTFTGCENLTSVSVNSANENFTSIDGCLVYKSENQLSFVPQGKEGDFTISSEIRTIHENAFFHCNKLKSITVPETVSYIARPAFSFCKNLETINFNCSLSGYSSIAEGCNNLTKYTVGANQTDYKAVDGIIYKKGHKHELATLQFVPNGIKGDIKIPEGVCEIAEKAFVNCLNITSIDFPKSLEKIYYYSSSYYGKDYAFNGIPTLEKIILRSSLPADSYRNLSVASQLDNMVVYAPYSSIELIKTIYRGTVIPIDMPYTINDFKIYIKGVSFKLSKTEGVTTPDEPLKVTVDGKEIKPDANGLYLCADLKDNTKYTIGITGCQPYSFTTKPIDVTFNANSTQKTITVKNLVISSDETFKFDKFGFTFNKKDYDFNGKEIVYKDLKPGTSYSFTPYVYQNDQKITFPSKSLTTKDIKLSINASKVGPTSVFLKGTAYPGDAKISKMLFYDGKTKMEGQTLTFTGLEPSTRYTLYFAVECEDGYINSESVNITTKALELETLQPKGVSSSCSIVAATTNMSDEETGAGFQWRKYDAPESLKSSEGNAAIYGGQLEGYLKNLQSTSYYKVRAFYKSNAGNYKYGDWVTFDPSDFSFFEPTVHTYATTDITPNTATVRGYVLAGTDNILKQGFEYWMASGQKRMQAYAPVDNNTVQTVLSNGQVMIVTLKDLTPETEYVYRAFVTTSAGTKYGEEQTFTTPYDPSGVGSVVSDETRTVVGYYDINGLRYDDPQPGFNIVVYSDGTTEKQLVKR